MEKAIIAAVLVVTFSSGFLLGQDKGKVVMTEATEREAAMMVHGKNARLIGFLCNNRNATVIAEEEDEFPDGCKEIRVLRDY